MNQQQERYKKLSELYLAASKGKVIQRQYSLDEFSRLDINNNGWFDLETAKFHFEDRIKPDTRTINGIEVPDWLQIRPAHGDVVYVENIVFASFFCKINWDNSDKKQNNNLLKRGILHATKEGAILNSKARLGVEE